MRALEVREKPLKSFELDMKLSGQRREYISIAKAQMGSMLAYIRDVLTHIEYLIEIVRSKPWKALEFGCGTGFHSCFISKFIRQLTCLDLDVRTIKIARQNMKKFGKEWRVSFVVGDVFHLPFRPRSFD